MTDGDTRPVYTYPVVKAVLGVTATVLLAVAIARLVLWVGGGL